MLRPQSPCAGLLFVAVLFVGLSFLEPTNAQCSDTETSIEAIEECVNAVREDPAYWNQFMSCDISRYPPAPELSRDSALQQAAQVQADRMASWGSINHNGFSSRVRSAGYNGPSISENVAMGYRSAFHVTEGWMCSSGHARNMMDCGSESFGTGVNCDRGQCFYAEIYGGSGRCGVPSGASPSEGYPSSYGGGYGQRTYAVGGSRLFGSGPLSRLIGSLFG